MASGEYNGAGIEVPDLLLYGGLAVAGYFIWKSVVKPASDVTNAVGNVTSELGNTGTAYLDIWQNILGKTNSLISGIGRGSVDNAQGVKVNNITQVHGSKNYVTSITPSGSAYGTPLVTVNTSAGQSSTIAQTANTYYPTIGIGFDSKNQGYSSMTPLKR